MLFALRRNELKLKPEKKRNELKLKPEKKRNELKLKPEKKRNELKLKPKKKRNELKQKQYYSPRRSRREWQHYSGYKNTRRQLLQYRSNHRPQHLLQPYQRGTRAPWPS